jgi:Protein of unknown function (DUF3375)
LMGQEEGLETVRGMLTLLQNEADKVMRTNQRLSATLRRLLDARAHAERERVAQLIREIRGHAVALAADPPLDEIGLELEVEPAIESPFRRTFWSEAPRFEAVALTDYEADLDARREAFQRLAAMHRLDWKQMRDRIKKLVDLRDAPSLGELLEVYPPEGGVIEMLGYLQIARDDGHLVNPSASQRVIVPPTREGGRTILVTVPLVTFTSERRHAHARRSS